MAAKKDDPAVDASVDPTPDTTPAAEGATAPEAASEETRPAKADGPKVANPGAAAVEQTDDETPLVLVHDGSDQEIEVDPAHAGPYFSQGWTEKNSDDDGHPADA